tara:strand:- start:1586 stop:1933 length:348 start_codon:yes stop_codon:yes gene_type:complete
MKNHFKYNEIKEYFNEFLSENLDYLKENDKYWREELHNHAFNTDYYIIGTYHATEWLGDQAFKVINIIKEYEQFNFGEVFTDLSEPEKVVNMYTYIVGEDIVADWLDANPISEEA